MSAHELSLILSSAAAALIVVGVILVCAYILIKAGSVK